MAATRRSVKALTIWRQGRDILFVLCPEQFDRGTAPPILWLPVPCALVRARCISSEDPNSSERASSFKLSGKANRLHLLEIDEKK